MLILQDWAITLPAGQTTLRTNINNIHKTFLFDRLAAYLLEGLVTKTESATRKIMPTRRN